MLLRRSAHCIYPLSLYGWLSLGRPTCTQGSHYRPGEPGDGWEDADVHGDSEANRIKALQMGANIVRFAFSGAEN